jgi:hypothetical protein
LKLCLELGKSRFRSPRELPSRSKAIRCRRRAPKARWIRALAGRHSGRAARRPSARGAGKRFPGGGSRSGAGSGQQRGRRRDQGLDAGTGDCGHRLSRRDEGQRDGGVHSRLFPPHRIPPAFRHRSLGRCQADQAERQRYRSPEGWPGSGRDALACVPPILTRTRACAMWARSSRRKWARRERNSLLAASRPSANSTGGQRSRTNDFMLTISSKNRTAATCTNASARRSRARRRGRG